MKEFKYFKFDCEKGVNPNNTGNSKAHNFMIWLLGKVIPKANPDFDHVLHRVTHWKIEFDNVNNHVNRELGFNEKGKIIAGMPMGKNYGYWSDIRMELRDFERFNPKSIQKEEFEKDWNELKYIYKISK